MVTTNRLNLLDDPILNVNICVERLIIIDYFASFDYEAITLKTWANNKQ